MKILFLSQRFLLPMDTGGKIRTGKLLEQLCRAHEITVVGNFVPGRDGPHRERMEALCDRYVPVPWREPRRPSPAFYARVLRNSLSRYPVTALNDYSADLEQAVLATLKEDQYDIAICDFVQSALLFRRVTGIARLLFQHNVEARIFERHRDNARDPFSKAFWGMQYRRMRDFEAAMVRAFDAVIAVSENDAAVFREDYGASGVHAIPTGVDVDYYTPAAECAPSSTELVFCGSMDWLPNQDGIRFFLEQVAPRLEESGREWSLTVVGRNPSEWLRQAAAGNPRLTLTGWVDDVRPYLQRAGVCIVPLRIGGGTRMKIYEAMAMGKPVVSTTVGAEGLDVVDGRDIRLVDEPAAFAEALVELLADAGERARMGQAARALVEANFGWPRVAERFAEICQEAIEQHQPAPARAAAGA